VRVTLHARRQTRKEPRKKYNECSDTQNEEYVKEVNREVEKMRKEKGEGTMLDYLEAVKKAGESSIPRNEAAGDKTAISEEVRKLVHERGRRLIRGDLEGVKETDQAIRKQKKREKKERQIHITRRDLDVRSRYLGIKQIKADFQPATYI
jgi:hypothetical protein